jgi:UDP-2,4-diacetamido-2,4,6-trideoxy-beta-L-altropyranose hydrolase
MTERTRMKPEPTKRGVLLVRADASVTSGTGHAVRCLALAQAWQQAGGDVVFVMAEVTEAIRELVRSERVEIDVIDATPGGVTDFPQTKECALRHKAEWLALDGYHFDAEYVAELQQVVSVLVIDDNGELESYSSELVLNQNAHANEGMYARRASRTRLLLGPRYVLLRKEFVEYRDWTRNVPEQGKRILLTMGGSDPKDLTPGILAALAGLPMHDLEIRVVVGGSAGNRSGVAEAAARFSGRVEVMSNVTNMAELMAWADLAIAGAGTTCWEMCRLGLPAIVIVVAENQRFIAGHLADIGAAVNAGAAESIDCQSLAQMAADLLKNRDRRLEMSQLARQLVDGKGSERVIEMMPPRDAPCT